MSTQKTGGGAGVQTPVVTNGGANDAPVDSILQGSLGKKLRDSYQEVVNEQVPDKFLALLEQL